MLIKNNLAGEYEHLLRLLNNDSINKVEDMAFTTYDGEVMDTNTRLRREYLKIDTMFTFDSGESLDFNESNHLRKTLIELSKAIENEEYNREILMEIIVLLNITLDCEVSFYKALLSLVREHKIEYGLEKLLTEPFDELYRLLSSGYSKRRP